MARSILADAGLPATCDVDDASDDDWAAVHSEWTGWATATSAVVEAIRRANDSKEDDSEGNAALGALLATARWRYEEGQVLLHASRERASGERLDASGSISLRSAAEASAPRGFDFGSAADRDLASAAPLPPVGAIFAAVYGEAKDTDVFRREKDRLTRGVAAVLKKTKQRIASFRKQIADAEDFEGMKTAADEIMAYLHGYVAGSNTMEVFDFTTGEARTIEIDPLIGAKDTAEKLYKKARKRKRTKAQVEPLLEAAVSEEAYLEQVEFAVAELGGDGGDDALALEEIAQELVDAKLLKPAGKGAAAQIREDERIAKTQKRRKAGAGKGGELLPQKQSKNNNKRLAREAAMSNVRTYASPFSGKDVFVGRNSAGNEFVSLKLGQDQDVWFHVRGAPGAHVVLRQQPGEIASEEDLAFAANLAAYHSKLRTGGKVDVSYTSPKFVRKPSGARLGMVTIDKESVMTGRPDDTEPAAEERAGKATGSW